MKHIYLFLMVMFCTSCTTTNMAGWKARLNNDIYESKSGEFQVETPISSGFCLKIEESQTEISETVSFYECHGYIPQWYVLTWYKTTKVTNKEQFYETTENSFIPGWSKQIFNPVDEGVLVSSTRTTVNGNPAIIVEVKTKTGKKPLMLKSSCIYYGDRILSISVLYDLSLTGRLTEPGSKKMFDNYRKFVESFKKSNNRLEMDTAK